MFSIIVEFLVEQGCVKDFEQCAISQAKVSLEKEEFCHVFEVCQDPIKATRFVFYERYEDQSAFENHLATFHYYDFDRTVTPWVISKNVDFLSKLPLKL